MATLVVAAAGAGIGSVIGGTFLGMSATALGWNLGMVAGGMLFAPKMPDQYGPRLGDLKVQASTYGNPVPIVYGAMRVAGNLIWSTDIAETAHTQSSGGKGGGGGVTQTSYTYAQSFAVAVCEGEIAGVRKIWANGKLIYNLADTADIATIVASNDSAASIRIYTGSETQVADSLIQANIGAADTPAYRGMAYVVFENLQLADYGNRTPNIEFEIINSGSYAHLAGEKTAYATGSFPLGVAFDSVTSSVWVANNSGLSVSKINILTGSRVDYTVGYAPTGVAFDSVTNSIWVANYNSDTVSKINVFTGSRTDYAAGTYPYGIAFDGVTNSVWVTNYNSATVSKISISTGSRTSYAVGSVPRGVAFDSVTNSVWVTNYGSNTVSKINIYSGGRTDYAVGTGPWGVTFDSVTSSVWVANNTGNTVSKVNILTGSKTDYAVGSAPVGVVFDNATNSVWVANYGGFSVSKVNILTGSKTDYAAGSRADYVAFDDETRSVWVTNSASNTVSKFTIADYGMTSVAATLSAIVSDICTGAGLTAGQIDVTALTDDVAGYASQHGTARSKLEQLMQAFYFDAVESDGKVKFVKRGGASAVSIPEDDLAAYEYGGAPPDTLVINRRQEMELPVEFNVQYMDSDAAYQIGSQYSQRLTTSSVNKASLNLALSLSATKAKQIADVLMYDAWTGRMTFDQTHGWKYSYLEPTDIITVTKGGRSYVMRIVDEDASGGIYRRQAVLEDTTVYTQAASAAGLPAPSETVSTVPVINLALMDIPLLRDQDDGVGYYAAACGYADGWTGAQAFKSTDDGATWSSFGDAFLNEATIGTASTALGDFTQNIFDESGSVTVVMINGTLASDTELNVLNGANVALLGNEVIQFRDATLTATNTYKLTGLLRGRQGTEWARSTHAIGDRFVLLSSTTTYIFTGTSGEYDAARKYRGVSLGGFLDDATAINFTNTAVAQECYAPVHLGGGRNAALDLTLNWVRRTRIGGGWNNYSDVPLGEASESYEVEIWDSGYATLKRTITGLSATTTTYTAAQQTTDFGSTQATVYWKAFQLSATRGRGYEARGTT